MNLSYSLGIYTECYTRSVIRGLTVEYREISNITNYNNFGIVR